MDIKTLLQWIWRVIPDSEKEALVQELAKWIIAVIEKELGVASSGP